MKRPPRMEDLMCVRVCQALGGIDLTEQAVQAIIEQRLRDYDGFPAAQSTMAASLTLALWAQRSILMLVDRDMVAQAGNSLGGGPLDLPPLPFPIVSIEADEDAVWEVGDDPDNPEGGLFAVQVIGIREVEQGVRWAGLIITASGFDGALNALFDSYTGGTSDLAPDDLKRRVMGLVMFELDRDGIGLWVGGALRGEEPRLVRHPKEDALWRLIVECVHFIDARGVIHQEVTPDRAERRRAARAGWTLPERLYWVRLSEAGVATSSGRSDRVYRCRWLVRGHWRHIEHGARRTWVRPYIKGPVGAPWKGRPVYFAGRSEAAV